MHHQNKYVDTLLKQYDEYKELLQQEAALSHQVAKAKILNILTDDLSEQHQKAKNDLQELSDAMTFADPIVWMLYKFEAYKDEAQPIRTLHDFRVHCSKPGYICTKRFEFLNDQLKQNGGEPLSNSQTYKDELLLSEIACADWLQSLTSNESFMQQWNKYEYHTVDGRVAKWENYLK